MGEDWNGEGSLTGDRGLPVYAISNGTVVEKSFNDAFGNYLIIRHDLPSPITVNGITTSTVYSLYGHMQSPAIVSVGAVVGIGQQIGNVGDTGAADGNPHVHLEIRLGYGAGYDNLTGDAFNGAPAGWVDPTDFINAHRTLTPELTSFSPGDNATRIAVDSNIVLNFAQTVVAGSGDIVIYDGTGAEARRIAVTDSTQVSFSGGTVTINPSADLAPNTTYYVNVAAGVIKDTAGNSFSGFSTPTAFSFMTTGPDLAGDTMAAARVISVGATPTTFVDYIGQPDTHDYYKFTTTSSGSFALSLTGLTGDADVYLLNSSGTEVAHSTNAGIWSESISVSSLAAGTYYVDVRPYSTAATNYTLAISAAGGGSVPADLAGNTMAAARVVTLGSTTSTYTDFVGPSDTADYYKFVTTGSTNFALSMNGLTADADVYLLNSSGTEVAHSYNTGTTPEAISVSNLAAGTYHVKVNPYQTAATNYTLGLSAAPVVVQDDLAGNTMAAARVVTLGSTTSTYTDFVGPSDTADYYKFVTTGATNFALSMNGLTADADVYLLNSSGTEVAHSYNTGTTAEAISVSNLAAGTYYVKVNPYQTAATNYTLGLSAAPVVVQDDLAGNTMAAARVVTLGSTTSTYTDYVGPTDTADYYKFVTTGATSFALNMTGLTADADVYLLNSSGTEVAHSYNTGTTAEAINVSNLAAGTYYVKVNPYQTAATNYTLGLSAAPVVVQDDLAGNTMAAARAVTLGSTTSTYTDFVGPSDTADYYKFVTTGSTNFALSMNGLTADADVYLLNSSGTEVAHSYNTGTTAEAISVSNLAAGTYYVKVNPYQTAATNYTLGLSAAPAGGQGVASSIAGALDTSLTSNSRSHVIAGNSDDNVLASLAGADHLDGGAGADTVTYVASPAGINVSLMTGLGNGGDAEGDTLVNIENLTGSNFDDRLEGAAGNNVLTGGMHGTGGDTVSYEHSTAGVTVDLAVTSAQNTVGAGLDTLTGFANVVGSAFNDTLYGTSAANTINGGAGDDQIAGRGGADVLTGGLGRDKFVFTAPTDSTPSDSVTITDFVHGTDIIALSAIDANTSKAGGQSFLYGGQNANVVSYSVTWFEDLAHGNTIVQADVNGDTIADLTIILAALNHHLSASDFIL